MYMELDGDDVAIAYIKDVTFHANRPDVEVVKMTKVGSYGWWIDHAQHEPPEEHFLMNEIDACNMIRDVIIVDI